MQSRGKLGVFSFQSSYWKCYLLSRRKNKLVTIISYLKISIETNYIFPFHANDWNFNENFQPLSITWPRNYFQNTAFEENVADTGESEDLQFQWIFENIEKSLDSKFQWIFKDMEKSSDLKFLFHINILYFNEYFHALTITWPKNHFRNTFIEKYRKKQRISQDLQISNHQNDF